MTNQLEKPPFETALGQEIFEKVTADQWNAWREMQIKIINEYRLDLSISADRQRLMGQMRAFLKLDGDAQSSDILEVGTPA